MFALLIIGHGHLVLIKNLRMFTVKILTWKGFLQLQMLPDHDAIKTSATKIKEVTKINTICSVLNDQPGIKVLVVRGSYVNFSKYIIQFLSLRLLLNTAFQHLSKLKLIKEFNDSTETKPLYALARAP